MPLRRRSIRVNHRYHFKQTITKYINYITLASNYIKQIDNNAVLSPPVSTNMIVPDQHDEYKKNEAKETHEFKYLFVALTSILFIALLYHAYEMYTHYNKDQIVNYAFDQNSTGHYVMLKDIPDQRDERD